MKSGGSVTEEAQVQGQRDGGPWGWYGYWYGRHRGTEASKKVVNVEKDPSEIGPGMAAQLLTALSNDANIQLVGIRSIKRNSNGSYSCKLERGERGPFIVRGMVTEFSETSDMSTNSKSGSLGTAGVVTGFLGRVTRNDFLKFAGYGTAAANPTYADKNSKRTGMVGIDMQIVNGSNGRIVGAVQSTGSFTTVTRSMGCPFSESDLRAPILRQVQSAKLLALR